MTFNHFLCDNCKKITDHPTDLPLLETCPACKSTAINWYGRTNINDEHSAEHNLYKNKKIYPALIPEIERLIMEFETEIFISRSKIILHRVLCEARMCILNSTDSYPGPNDPLIDFKDSK